MDTFAGITNFSNLQPKAQTHLKNVYSTLCGMLALAAAGVVAQIKLQFDVMLCSLAALGFLIWLWNSQYEPFNADQERKRLALLGTFGFLKGASLGPLIHMNLLVQPELVAVAFAGTATIFACFSIAAMCAKERSYLYLGGFLGSAASLMCLMSLANLFLWSPYIYLVQLYGGLLMFTGYVIYDTQLIIAKASATSTPDYVMDSLQLFIDFVAIFVRILIILMRNNDKKRSQNRDRQSR